MIFHAGEYAVLHTLFTSGYPGYRPHVQELPNGDGKVDAGKRYLHVSLKYGPPKWAVEYLARAHFEACRIAEALNVPAEFYPRAEYGCLRVLEYPPRTGSAEHTDFDLFTVNCYRNVVNQGLGDGVQSHLGELAEVIGLGKATPHWVDALPREQHSIVYFAMPDHNAYMPCPPGTVGEWLQERMSRSRTGEEYK